MVKHCLMRLMTERTMVIGLLSARGGVKTLQ
jgi:hypothetical protein